MPIVFFFCLTSISFEEETKLWEKTFPERARRSTYVQQDRAIIPIVNTCHSVTTRQRLRTPSPNGTTPELADIVQMFKHFKILVPSTKLNAHVSRLKTITGQFSFFDFRVPPSPRHRRLKIRYHQVMNETVICLTEASLWQIPFTKDKRNII